MLSNAAKYAIRATLYLAVNSSETKKVGAKKIAEEIKVPLPFLSKSLQQLTKSHVISSTKGPNGGFFIDEANGKKSIWDVISCMDGIEKFNQCFLGLSDCDNVNPCAVHHLVVGFRNKIMHEFRDKNIHEISQKDMNSLTKI